LVLHAPGLQFHCCKLTVALHMAHAGILSALSCKSLDQLQELLGPEGSAALSDLQQLWRLADGYGFQDWLVFDASVVRGLAYYTGEIALDLELHE
jgi:histidyl-tRNA synthetase